MVPLDWCDRKESSISIPQYGLVIVSYGYSEIQLPLDEVLPNWSEVVSVRVYILFYRPSFENGFDILL